MTMVSCVDDDEDDDVVILVLVKELVVDLVGTNVEEDIEEALVEEVLAVNPDTKATSF